MGGKAITNLATPSQDSHAATKFYVNDQDSSLEKVLRSYIDSQDTGIFEGISPLVKKITKAGNQTTVSKISFTKKTKWTMIRFYVKLYERVSTVSFLRDHVGQTKLVKTKGDGFPSSATYKYNYYGEIKLVSQQQIIQLVLNFRMLVI